MISYRLLIVQPVMLTIQKKTKDECISVASSADVDAIEGIDPSFGHRGPSTFRLICPFFSEGAVYMTLAKNDDMDAYKSIAKRAWKMYHEIWDMKLNQAIEDADIRGMPSYQKFQDEMLVKHRVYIGRFRWMAWRSHKGK